MRSVSESSFAIVSNGFADGPAQALRDFLNMHRAARVTTVFHPLVAEGDTRHEITIFEEGRLVSRHHVKVPVAPPYTYVMDPLIPVRMPRVGGWFGFNNMAAARGLVARSRGRAEKVAYWCVDFVPNRFGRSPATWMYDRLDRLCCRRVNVRFELSDAARKGRNNRLALPDDRLAPTHIAPMGAWVTRTPTTTEQGYAKREVVFLGHLVERQGVELLLRAAALSKSFTVRIIGRGPEGPRLRALAFELGLGDRIIFQGFVEEYQEVERLLSGSSIAVAPYTEDPSSFTQFADPGKLKSYLAAGLPVILTATPPNAKDLAGSAGAEIVPRTETAWASAIERLLGDPQEWARRRAQAISAARQFDWEVLLPRALEHLRFKVDR